MIGSYLLSRIAEPSTWRGLFLLATVAGINISPEQQQAILTAGLGLVGLVGAFMPDKVRR